MYIFINSLIYFHNHSVSITIFVTLLFFFVFYAADDSVSALNFLELATSTVETIIKLNRCNVKHIARFDR